ncbi:MAG: hypothetical protein PHT27_07745, partial [Candidatus Izemoplasmatales bacterium]|nr:hypothetical protein [Candidatus Izemoplasmatales bacterium]
MTTEPKNVFFQVSEANPLGSRYITPVMYTDSDGYFPELIDCLTNMTPSRRLNCFINIDTSTGRNSSIYYPENRDDYAKVWSIILAIFYANNMISFYTAAGGLLPLGCRMISSAALFQTRIVPVGS